MVGKTPITIKGYQAVEKELNQLIKVDREELKVVIAEARALGDLKENAEYHAAKEKQSLLEGRISHLQSVIATSQIIKISDINSEKIVFGATVTLMDIEKDITVIYQIVGQIESDKNKGRISYTSPLGKALIGKEQGDTVIVKAPKGDVEYEVESFEFYEA
jgi:transcription elongation factor GreA